MLKIKEKIPELDAEYLQQIRFDEDRYSLYVFYRGFHCPICKKYIENLNEKADELKALGVSNITAISGDETLTAVKTRDNWDLSKLQLAYNLSEQSMRDWGLYISNKIKDNEPEFFNEPALFLINQADETVEYVNVGSMPFARPHIDDLIEGIKMMKENDYPARGNRYPKK